MVKQTDWAIYTVAAHGRNPSLYANFESVVNRPTVNRGLIDDRPADRSTGPTKIVDRPNKKWRGLLDVNLVDLVLSQAILEQNNLRFCRLT